jgi:pimeloyl-ACP methyl ester carboxylesterase
MGLPGHREDDPDPAGCTIERYVSSAKDGVREIARVHGPPVVVGHSMGAQVAEALSRGNPDVLALVLFASAPPYESFMEPLAQLKLASYFPMMPFRSTMFLTDKDFRHFFLNDLHDEVEIQKRLKQFVPESWSAILEMAIHGRAMRPELLLTKHVAVFAAKHDRIMTLRSQEHIARRFKTKLKVFDAGHMSLLWNKEALLELAAFIDGLPAISTSPRATAAE